MDQIKPRVITEYAIVAFFRQGSTVLYGPTTSSEWNARMTLHEAAAKYFPGGEVVTRTRTIYPDKLSDWDCVPDPARTGA